MRWLTASRAQTAGEYNACCSFFRCFRVLINTDDNRYGRHVAVPWSTLLPAFPHVLPRASAAQSEPQPEPEPEPSPGQPALAPCMAMRTLVQNYVRHASNELEVCLPRRCILASLSARWISPTRRFIMCTGERVLLSLLARPG
jgi:hypothetical protein